MHDTKNKSGVKLTMYAVHACIVKLLSPVSKNEDTRRREFILHTILLISIPFLAFADSLIARNTLRLGIHYHGVPFWIGTLVVSIFVGLFVASKKGHGKSVSYILIGFYSLAAIYSGWHWGASLPATLLTVVLVSVMSSILIGSRFGLAMSSALILVVALLAYHEIKTLGTLPWKFETVTFMDIIIYSALLLFITALSWLSNREIQKSLDRARTSEKLLAEERDSLERKVVERTKLLKATQEARITELSQAAEFGKISQGLFHDLMTPLSSVALYMETLRDIDIPEIQNSRAYIEKAMRASTRMGTFMNYIRRSIHSYSGTSTEISHENETVDIKYELAAAVDLMGYKARAADVRIESNVQENLLYKANSLYFLQIFMNLISNAIDACEEITGEKRILITATETKDSPAHKDYIQITVTDNGEGIPTENQAKIFDNFYTTKTTTHGNGIGLHMIKKIVEEKLHGSIHIESSTDKNNSKRGTTFTVMLY